jgi:hypothetical protein
MTICEQLRDAIPRAPTLAALDNLSRLIWSGHGEAILSDDQAQELAEALEACRATIRARIAGTATKPASGARRPPRSPDRKRSIERRRSIAASGALPSRLACRFTTSEVAVLSILAQTCRGGRTCELHIDAIAGMSGTSRSTVKRAMRLATTLGMLAVTERRRPGRKSDTNMVAVVSSEWRSWLERGARHHRGSKPDLHEYESKIPSQNGGSGARRSPAWARERAKEGLFDIERAKHGGSAHHSARLIAS